MLTVSIITVCYNAAEKIRGMLDSVQEQTYPHIEHVVIDGGSGDGTVDIVRQHGTRVATLVSEPDEGIYDAMNKGIKAATGDVLLFLNADDRLCDFRVAADVAAVFGRDPGLELVYGDVLRDLPEGLERVPQMAALTRRELARTTICHQVIFSRRELFSRCGGFDGSLRVVADYAWLMKAATSGARARHLHRDVAIIGTEGLSHTASYEDEKRRAMAPYYTPLEMFCWRTLPREVMPRIRRVIAFFLFPVRFAERVVYQVADNLRGRKDQP